MADRLLSLTAQWSSKTVRWVLAVSVGLVLLGSWGVVYNLLRDTRGAVDQRSAPTSEINAAILDIGHNRRVLDRLDANIVDSLKPEVRVALSELLNRVAVLEMELDSVKSEIRELVDASQ